MFAFKPSLQIDKFSPYIHFPQFFSKEECDRIKRMMGTGFRAQVEGDGTGKVSDVRGTTVFGLELSEKNKWLFQKLSDAVIQSNFDIWGFDLAGFHEPIQISKYDVGDHYDWHMDIGGKVLSQRKLSLVAQLSTAFEYQGGELEFFQHGDAPKDQGTLILFPSYMHHRVRAVVRGTRHSLVAWLSGNPYK